MMGRAKHSPRLISTMKFAVLVCLFVGVVVAEETFGEQQRGRPYIRPFPRPFPGPGGYPGYPPSGPYYPPSGPYYPPSGPYYPGVGGRPYYPGYSEFVEWYLQRNPNQQFPGYYIHPVMTPEVYSLWYNWYMNRNPNGSGPGGSSNNGGKEVTTGSPGGTA